MRARRVYVPLTYDQLRGLATERVLAGQAEGYAALTAPRADSRASAAADEDAEYLAFEAAAHHAGELDMARRVVAAADVAAGDIRELPTAAGDCMGVITTADLPLRAFVSVHIDEAGATDTADSPDLLWYDITELDVVLAEITHSR